MFGSNIMKGPGTTFFRFSVVAIAVLLVASCGGGDSSSACDSGDIACTPGQSPLPGSDGSGGGAGETNVSYEPLMVFEADADFSGFGSDGLYAGHTEGNWIRYMYINPVNSNTLSSLTPTSADQFSVTVDGVEIDEFESFPTLQPVISTDVFLRTALVFDLSDSTGQTDYDALITEAKAYITAVQAHSNETIRNQEFVVWAFATDTMELTSGFTSVPTVINDALDQVVTLHDAVTLGNNSTLHRMIVEAVGRYQELPNFDFRTDGNNDLVDSSTADGVLLSQMVLFSSGPDTTAEMPQDLMVSAVQSQNFVQLNEAGSSSEVFLNKPVFYYVLGGSSEGVPYQALADEVEVENDLILSSGAYNFSDNLIQNQIAAIARRIDLSNQYLYRYAFVPRTGDHESVFTGANNPNSFALTTNYSEADILGDPPAEPEVEIDGPNGEYISNGVLYLSEADTFTAATRWTNLTYGNGDYSWSISGGTGTLNSDGSYTVDSISGTFATLTLTNNILGENAIILVFD